MSNEEVITFVNNYFAEKNTKYYLVGLKRWEHCWESVYSHKETMYKNYVFIARSDTLQTTLLLNIKPTSELMIIPLSQTENSKRTGNAGS